MTAPTPLERNAHRSILERARRRGAYVIVNTVPPCDTGTPDHSWCFVGRFVGAELKPDGARDLEPIQRARGVEILAAGGVYAVLRRVADVDVLCDALIRDGYDPTTRRVNLFIATNNPERPIIR